MPYIPTFMLTETVKIERCKPGKQSKTGDYTASCSVVVSALACSVQPKPDKLIVLNSGVENLTTHTLYANHTSAGIIQANDIVTLSHTGEKLKVVDVADYNFFIPHYEADLKNYVEGK